MRKVAVMRPPINYVVISAIGLIAWFIDANDAIDFVHSQTDPDRYEIAEARK